MRIKTMINLSLFSLFVFYLISNVIVFDHIKRIKSDARVVNFAGIVRGASQRLVKLELVGIKNEQLMRKIDRIIDGLINGDKELNLPKAQSPELIEKLQEVKRAWEHLKNTIIEVRKTKNFKKLVEESEDFFKLTNELVFTAEYVSKGRVLHLMILQGIILVLISAVLFIIFLITNQKIIKPLDNLTYIFERLKNYDFSVKIRSSSRDEIGQIIKHLQETIENFKSLLKNVKGASDSLAFSVEKLNDLSKGFGDRLDIQVEKSTQIVSAAEEMSITIGDVAKNTASILEESIESAKVAKEGEEITLKTAQEIKAIDERAEKLREVTISLEEHSKKIEDVITFIKEIAEQTNLLALNATIEAARAGEHGKSFAVVAGEIRKLAERTDKSVDEISETIKKIQDVVEVVKGSVEEITTKIEQGVELSDQTTRVLNTIAEKSERLQEMIQNITNATDQMSEVAEQVSKDIGSVAEATKELKEGVKTLVQTSEEVAKLSVNLKEIVNKFRI